MMATPRRAAWALATLWLVAAGCRPRQDAYTICKFYPPRVAHVVVFWLKEPGNAEHRRRIIEASYRFRSIPGVLDVEAGPVHESPRPNVDKTYDVAVVIRLRHEPALEEYQSNPLHKAMLEEVGPLVERVVVYDFTYPQPQKE